jgi:chromosome segregation ATPase
MSKQSTPSKQILSPAEQIAQAESTIAALEGKREQLQQRVAEHISARERLSYLAHVQQDVSASRELSEAREAALRAEQELTEIESALVTAGGKLNEAQRAEDREERRAEIKRLQEHSKNVRALGPFMDKGLDNLRDGLIALSKNVGGIGRSHHQVATLIRVLQVAFFDTAFRMEIGIPDYPARRDFSNFSQVISGWCDSNDANLAHELAALDGHEQKTEAA